MKMDVEAAGTTAFLSEANGVQRFRFAVSVHDDKLKIWLEDRVSKQQWRTGDLQLSDYVTTDSAIPRAKPGDYAKRFVDCLLAEQAHATEARDDEIKASMPYTRSLSDVSKDGCRSLVLGVRLGVASAFFVDLEYAFTLLPVALEKVDILDAQVRDLKDEIELLKASKAAQDAEIATLKLLTASTTPAPMARASVELRAIDAAEPNSELRWGRLPSVYGERPFVLSDADMCVGVARAGTYLISLCISHTSSNTSTQFELVVDGEIVRKLTDGSPMASCSTKQAYAIGRVEKQNYVTPTNYTRDSTFVVTTVLPPNGKVKIIYRGNSCVNVGSTMSLVEL